MLVTLISEVMVPNLTWVMEKIDTKSESEVLTVMLDVLKQGYPSVNSTTKTDWSRLAHQNHSSNFILDKKAFQ